MGGMVTHTRMGWLAFFILVQGCAAHTVVRAPAPAALDDANRIVAVALSQQQIPGLSLVVMKGDDIVLARGHGLEDVGRKDAVTATTVFMLNSMTKQFVAALVLKLVEEKKLTLDDPVARHLSDFTRLPPGLRLRHLLSHTSGVRDEHVQPELSDLFDKPGTSVEDYVAVARHSPADFAPGSRWSYANINYLMLTLVVERLTGKSLEQLLAERFFGPLGLSSMRLCPSQPGQGPGEARGHIRPENAFLPHPPENIRLFRGAGGFCGNAVDMARWIRALATEKVVSPQSYAQMTTPARLTNGREADYGFAMALVAPDGVQRFGHGGYGSGFSAQAAYYRDAELTVVVLTNRFVFPEYIERKISRRLLGVPEPVLREIGLSAEQRQRYIGTYDLGIIDWYVQVVERDDRLWFELTAPKMTMPLIYLGNGEFVNEAGANELGGKAGADGYRLYFSSAEGLAQEFRLLGMGMASWYGVRRQ